MNSKNTLSFVDLHTHSTFSDGTYTPEEIVKEAVSKNLSAVALTDHDCVFGLDDFTKAGEKYGIETIKGIELASYFESDKIDRKVEIHIVGLFIDNKNEALLEKTKTILAQRIDRNKKMVAHLTELGFPMTYDELVAVAGHDHCSRTHYALLMVQKGYVKDKAEAFEKYFAAGMPAYVPRILPTPPECVSLIKNAGGIPILAHPTLYRLTDEQIEIMVRDLKECGIEGIETMYSTYTPQQQKYILSLSEKYNLIKSGGSDFHGLNKAGIYLGTGKGSLAVPKSYLDDLKEWRRKNV